MLTFWAVINLIHNVKIIDKDNDGLLDNIEEEIGTNTNLADSDYDDFKDFEEYNYWNERYQQTKDESYLPTGDLDNDSIANILDEDSDGDGLSDGQEIKFGSDPSNPDTDGDGVSDLEEIQQGSDPDLQDSDMDGIPDDQDSDPDGYQDPGDLIYGQDPVPSTRGPTREGYHKTPTCFVFFNPYLAGDKRYSAYDSLTSDYNSYVEDNNKDYLQLSDEEHERVFIATIPVKLKYGYINIPSVSPNANIISYNTYPTGITVNFYKDGADNYYIRTSKKTGTMSLTFKTSAHPTYFDFNIAEDTPDHLTINNAEYPEDVKKTIPANIINAAQQVIQKLNLQNENRIGTIIDTMKDYFSSFEAGDIPSEEEQENAYLAMALSEHGCCYVRAYSYFVTANAIGIPTRLITNECHAFAESYISDIGWVRISLGGCGANICNPNEDVDPFQPDDTPDDDGDDDTPPQDRISTSTEIESISSEAFKDGYFTVSGYVKDVNDTAVENIAVEIFVNKTKDSAGEYACYDYTNNQGFFNIKCNVPRNVTSGTNQIVAHCIGDDTYKPSWSDPPIEIYSNTTIVFDMVSSVGLNNQLVIRGYLYDDGGIPVSGENIDIYYDNVHLGNTFSDTTDSQGEFQYFYIPTTLGGHEIRAVFNGSTYLSASENTFNINVKDNAVNLELSVTNYNLLRGEELTTSGELKKGNNDPLTDAVVKIIYDNEIISEDTTNSQGEFESTFNIPMDSNLGHIWVTAYYYGSENYAEDYDQESIFIKANTEISVNSLKTKYLRNQTIHVNGSLKDDNQQPLENKQINVEWKNQNQEMITDTNGLFSINFTISSNADFSKSTVSINFDGDNLYKESDFSWQIEIVETLENNGKKTNKSQNKYILPLIAAIVIILVLVGVIMLFKKRQNQQGPSIQDIASNTINNLKSETDYRKSVIRCYKQMCNWLARQGVKKGSFQTPREFAMAAKKFLTISPESLYTLIQIFEKARYSKHEINSQDKDQAIKCLNEIISRPLNLQNQQPNMPPGSSPNPEMINQDQI